MAAVEFDAMDAARNLVVTVRVKNLKVLAFRVAVGARIIRFGAWVAGFGGVEFVEDSK